VIIETFLETVDRSCHDMGC